MTENNYEKYLSLKTAAELYGYTRDHLGLMIRRGKLTGTKLGNYYVTTDNWMVEYIKKYADQNHPVIKNKLSNKFLTDIFSTEKKSRTPVVSRKIAKNLPKIINNNKADDVLYPDVLYKNNIVNNAKIDIKSEILKDLALYNLSLNSASHIKNSKTLPSFVENSRLLMSLEDLPYTILPTRKMEDAERRSVLKKLES